MAKKAKQARKLHVTHADKSTKIDAQEVFFTPSRRFPFRGREIEIEIEIERERRRREIEIEIEIEIERERRRRRFEFEGRRFPFRRF